MGGEVSTDFKSSNGIEISRLVQVLLNFDWFQGSPPGGWWGGWMLVGGGEMVPPHTCTCMCMHAHDIIVNSQGFPQWGWPFAWNYHVYHVRVCMRARACVWGDTPQPPPTPRAAGSPKHQNSISLELIKIIRFCLKILYLWTFLNSYRL